MADRGDSITDQNVSNPNKVFVGGLSWNTTEGMQIEEEVFLKESLTVLDTLRGYMSSFGKVENLIIMKDRLTGRSRGFAFVILSNMDEVEKACNASHELDGRTLEIKASVTQTERREQGIVPKSSMSGPQVTKKLFVGGLSPETTDEDLTKAMAALDPESCYTMKDHATEKCRGFGFCLLRDETPFDECSAKGPFNCLDREIEIRAAIPRSQQAPRARPGDFRGMDRGMGGPPRGAYGGMDRGIDRGYGGGYGAPPQRERDYNMGGGYDSYAPQPYDSYGGGYQQPQAYGSYAPQGGYQSYGQQQPPMSGGYDSYRGGGQGQYNPYGR